jgi:DNA-binding HxlR family transcriptional regulator
MQTKFDLCTVKPIKKRSLCPVSSALDIIGDKWSLLIVRDLVFEGKNTYGQFRRGEEGIATNILADRLEWLEQAGIIMSKPHPDGRVKATFQLTPKGADLIPLIVDLVTWSDKYLEISPQAKQMAKAIRADRDGVITMLRSKVIA